MKSSLLDVSVLSILTGATDANPVTRVQYRKRGGQTTSREFSVWCESQTSDLAFAVQNEQKDRADLVAQLGATSEALRTRWRSDADLKKQALFASTSRVLQVESTSAMRSCDETHSMSNVWK